MERWNYTIGMLETWNNKRIRLLIFFAVFSAGALLISNLSAVKLWNMAGIAVDGGLVLFPVTYIISDLIIEFFGKKISRTIIWSGFALNITAAIVFYIVIALPPYPGWDMQEAYAMVLGFSPRIILGSLCGYVLSTFLNNYVFVRMKESDTVFSRSFIARALGSSAFAHLVDSAVFETVAFLGVLTFQEFLMQALFAYLLGIGLEIILSPIEVLIERKLKAWLA